MYVLFVSEIWHMVVNIIFGIFLPRKSNKPILLYDKVKREKYIPSGISLIDLIKICFETSRDSSGSVTSTTAA